MDWAGRPDLTELARRADSAWRSTTPRPVAVSSERTFNSWRKQSFKDVGVEMNIKNLPTDQLFGTYAAGGVWARGG